MEKEQISDYTRRISQSNASGLVIVTYDIMFANLKDAKAAYEKEDWERYKQSVRQAQRAINALAESLNFSYDMAKNLYQIYVYCRDRLAEAMYKRSISEVEESETLMRKLYVSFEKVAENDTAAPIMKNTQQVYAGYTYGRDDVVENCQELDKSRGFLV